MERKHKEFMLKLFILYKNRGIIEMRLIGQRKIQAESKFPSHHSSTFRNNFKL